MTSKTEAALEALDAIYNQFMPEYAGRTSWEGEFETIRTALSGGTTPALRIRKSGDPTSEGMTCRQYQKGDTIITAELLDEVFAGICVVNEASPLPPQLSDNAGSQSETVKERSQDGAAEAPGHTDLMIAPEDIDAYFDEHGYPPDPQAPTAVSEAQPVALSRDQFAAIMWEEWDEICRDSECHPLDITHGKGSILFFNPGHWVDAVYERLALAPTVSGTQGGMGADAKAGDTSSAAARQHAPDGEVL